MRIRTHLALVAAALLPPLACDYPTFEFRARSTTSGTGGSSGGGAYGGGAGAVGGNTGLGGATTSTTASGGAGNASTGGTGGATIACTLADPECPEQLKCSVADELTGALACLPAGVLGENERCTFDADCLPGLWCDTLARVCKVLCDAAGDCSSNSCMQARNGAQTAIPGLGICASHCDPVSPTICPTGTVCIWARDDGEFDCRASGNRGIGEGCSTSEQCQDGALCMDEGLLGVKCELWCRIDHDECPWLKTCSPIGGQPTYDGESLGYCCCSA